MSAMRHATISAWKREEDGSYAAELHGWALHVRWHAESATTPRGFTWEAHAADHASQRLSSARSSRRLRLPWPTPKRRSRPTLTDARGERGSSAP